MIQKILDKKPVFNALLFTVNELSVEVKPGVIQTHHSVERKPSVLVLPITAENEVYLVSQYRYNLGKEVLECTAGYVDDGEDPLDAAKRELKEETGFSAETWKRMPDVGVSASSLQTTVHLFIATGLSTGETHFDDAEDIETIKMPIAEAVEKVFSGEIAIASSAALILMADTLLKKGQL